MCMVVEVLSAVYYPNDRSVLKATKDKITFRHKL